MNEHMNPRDSASEMICVTTSFSFDCCCDSIPGSISVTVTQSKACCLVDSAWQVYVFLDAGRCVFIFLEQQQMSVLLWRSLDNRKLTCRWSPAEGLVVKRLRPFKDSVKNPPPVTHLLFTFSWRLFHCCRAVWQQRGTRLDVDPRSLKPPLYASAHP